jgi:uncharacterized protein (TIGR02266 family)
MSDKQSVLIICRTAAGQMYLGVLLNRIWYSPVLAKTVEEGVMLAQKTRFSLVLYDSDATETAIEPAIHILRSDPAVKSLPLVIFRTDDSAVSSESLLTQGCSAVLLKPLDLTILYGVLQRLSGQPRSTPRVTVKFRVEILEGIPEKSLTCINLSEGGLYLRTAAPLQEGTVIHVKFTLPFDTEAIELAAEVVRTLPLAVQLATDPGMGLKFVNPPENTIMKIRNFVDWEMTGDLEWKSNI